MLRNITAFTLVGLVGTAAQAAVITDPTLTGPGADTFDPAGFEEVDFTPAPSDTMATLEARSDIRSIQDFTGFATGNNTFAFTDPSTPDIQFRISGTSGDNAGRQLTQANAQTSAGAAYTIDAVATTPAAVVTIDFGSFDSGTGTFDSNTNAVAATGFTLNQIGSANSFNIQFQTDAGVTLQTVTFSGQAGSNPDPNGNATASDYFVGFESSTFNIGQIVISRTGSTFNSGLDDFGFTLVQEVVVPEPASFALLGLGALCLMPRRRRA